MQIYSWKSNEIPEEIIENMTKSNSNFALTFADYHVLPGIHFNRHCSINNNISIPKKVINLYISYILNPWLRHLNTDFTLKNCLFGSIKLTKNANPDKRNSSYAIGFDFRSNFSFPDGSVGKYVIIFGDYMSSSVHIDNENKDILVLSEGPTQGLDDTTLTAEAKYLYNFRQPRKRFTLSLHYNGSNSFLFLNVTIIYQSKVKDSEIKVYTLSLGNIWKYFTINNREKIGPKR